MSKLAQNTVVDGIELFVPVEGIGELNSRQRELEIFGNTDNAKALLVVRGNGC